MTEQGIGVKVELGIQRLDVAIALQNQGIDFYQRCVGLGVDGVEFLQHIDSPGGRFGRHADAVSQGLRLGLSQPRSRVDSDFEDFFGRVMCHLLNVHAARRRGHEGHPLAGAIGERRNIVFLLNVRTFLDQQAANLLSCRAGLVGHQLHAKNFPGQLSYLVDRAGQFDATALAAATSMDLCLDHPHRAAEFLCCFNCLLHRVGGDAPGYRHPKLSQDSLALVLVNFHRDSRRNGFFWRRHIDPGLRA